MTIYTSIWFLDSHGVVSGYDDSDGNLQQLQNLSALKMILIGLYYTITQEIEKAQIHVLYSFVDSYFG